MFFPETCQTSSRASTFDLSDLQQLGLWLSQMESYGSQFLKTNTNCGYHLGMQVQ